MRIDLALESFDPALRGAAIAILLLLAVVLWRDRRRSWVARLGAVFATSLCFYVLSSAPRFEASVPAVFRVIAVALSNGNVVLFWLFACALLDDEFELRYRHAAAWIGLLVLGGANCAWLAHSGSPWAKPMALVLGVAPLLFAILTIYVAALHWRQDLIEQRRRLRGFIVIVGTLYVVVTAVARLTTVDGRLSEPSGVLDMTVLTVIIMVIARQWLVLSGTVMFASGTPLTGGPAALGLVNTVAAVPLIQPEPQGLNGNMADTDSSQVLLAKKLEQLMTQERVYRQENLTVASLAARMGIPEYRLRRLINQHLGQRNFNSFVNQYRLDEVTAAFADPRRRDLPVLTLALEAGFQSIGPFNRAFKARTGLTPTEFRRQKLADFGIG